MKASCSELSTPTKWRTRFPMVTASIGSARLQRCYGLCLCPCSLVSALGQGEPLEFKSMPYTAIRSFVCRRYSQLHRRRNHDALVGALKVTKLGSLYA